MKPETYCPIVDGIPGLFSGTPSIIEEVDDKPAPDENNPQDDHHDSSSQNSE